MAGKHKQITEEHNFEAIVNITAMFENVLCNVLILKHKNQRLIHFKTGILLDYSFSLPVLCPHHHHRQKSTRFVQNALWLRHAKFSCLHRPKWVRVWRFGEVCEQWQISIIAKNNKTKNCTQVLMPTLRA